MGEVATEDHLQMPQNSNKQLSPVVYVCNSSTEQVEIRAHGLFNLAYLLGSTPVRESISKHEVEGSCRSTPEVALWPPHALAHILHTHTHTHLRMMQVNTYMAYKHAHT